MSAYQLALRASGISPNKASSRKQIRQRPNFRRTARDRPHRWQRRTVRTLNFGVRLALSIQAVFAIPLVSSRRRAYATRLRDTLRGVAAERAAELAQQGHRQTFPGGRRRGGDV